MDGSELALGSAMLAALGAAVYFVWSGSSTPSTQPPISNPIQERKSIKPTAKGNKGKKRKTQDLPSFVPLTEDSGLEASFTPTVASRKKEEAPKVVVQRAMESSGTVPGGFGPILSASEVESTGSATKGKKKKSTKKKGSTREGTPTSSQLLAPPAGTTPAASTSSSKASSPAKQSIQIPKQPLSKHALEASATSEFDSEGWTQVPKGKRGISKKGNPNTSTTESASANSVTEEEDSVASKEKGETLTFAEKMLPKPVKTAVDDMLEGPKETTVRVIRVPGQKTPGGTDKPAPGLTWDDYEDGEELKGSRSGIEADEDEDDGWGVVNHKKRGTPSTLTPQNSTYAPSQSTLASTSQPTKKQRQNENRKEREKAAKAEAERQRLETLARHKRELDKARIDEQFKTAKGDKVKSGGMKMIVDEKGNNIWE